MANGLRQQINISSLESYITTNVPEIAVPIAVSQFGFGQSNPTYLIQDHTGRKFVMRKKPPGKLLSKTAHQIEREYRVLQALRHTDIPVPKTYSLCEDSSVLGTPFYLMEFLDGRIFEDPTLPGVSPQDRAAMWEAAVTTLARLHRVELRSVGLEGYGKPTGFYQRQLRTWKTISKAQQSVVDVVTGEPVSPVPGFQAMLAFFADEKYQPQDRATLIHGDYKIDNLMFHKTEPRIVGILDWEMSTIGHPLSDLSNLLQPWTVLATSSEEGKKRLVPVDELSEYHGLPSIPQCLAWYRQVARWDPTPEMTWADAFAMFRMAVVRQGIAARHAARQSSSTRAYEFGQGMFVAAELAQTFIRLVVDKPSGVSGRL